MAESVQDPVGISAFEHSPWYQDGLRFACTECGKCCTGTSGYVWVEAEEARRIAAELHLELQDFGRRFLRRVGRRYALLDKPRDPECIFLDGKKCRIYRQRPKQCCSYPWWPENLKSPDAWEATAAECEGISSESGLVTLREIEAALRSA